MKALIKDWTELTVETGTNDKQNVRYQVYITDTDTVVLFIYKNDDEIDSVEFADSLVLNNQALEDVVKQRIVSDE